MLELLDSFYSIPLIGERDYGLAWLCLRSGRWKVKSMMKN